MRRPRSSCPGGSTPGTPIALAVRSDAPAAEISKAMQEAVMRRDADLARITLDPFERRVEWAAGDLEAWRAFFAVVGGLLLFLSAMGIYGIVAFAVARRTREIGVRMSLGSSRRGVLGSVLGDAVRLALPGVAVGTLAGYLLGRHILDGFLIHLGIAMGNGWILAASAALGGTVVLLASVVPARRAAGLDPMMTLRGSTRS